MDQENQEDEDTPLGRVNYISRMCKQQGLESSPPPPQVNKFIFVNLDSLTLEAYICNIYRNI